MYIRLQDAETELHFNTSSIFSKKKSWDIFLLLNEHCFEIPYL